ncbi:MAG TPA: hypothetical protein ENI31_03680 [Candidatus Omnitrophica bacterium]|nr:hypothetical protein [Candidatus Omnitrophota bacterium]
MKNPISFWRKGVREYLGFEFDNDSLRIAYLRSSALNREVVYFINKDISQLSSEEIVSFIKSQLSKFKIKKAQVIYTISSHLVITRNIEVPSQDPKEIRDIISLQASRHTPYGREEIIADFVNIGTYRQSYTRILLVIVNRDVIRKQYEILKQAGFEPDKVSFSSESVVKGLSYLLNLNKEDNPVCIIHIDSSFTDFNIVLKDKIIFLRSLPLGIQHLSIDKQENYKQFVEEVKASLDVYKSEDIEAYPVRVLVTGIVEEVRDIADFLNSCLKVPTEVIPYLNYFSLSSEARENTSLTKICSFLGVMSSGLVYEALGVDLTPQEAKLKKLFEERSKEVIKTGILILAFFVVISGFFLGKVYLKDLFLKKLDKKFSQIHPQAEALEKEFSQIKVIKNYLSRRGYSLEVLAEIYKALPDEVRISELRFNRAGEITLKGTSSSMTAIFTFVEDLNKSNYFKEVETRYTTKRKEKDRDVTDFEIRGSFRKEKSL